MISLSKWQDEINQAIQQVEFPLQPASLYEPSKYILSLGGKRLRPVFVLMGCELLGGKSNDAIHAATGIEVFHNFTLMHDDIMDNAPLRRGMITVHEKWNSNIAILAGDALYTRACQLMMIVPDHALREVLSMFTTTAMQVCEGQQLDMDFENRQDVTMNEYLEMIRLKTAVLLGCSFYTGACIAGASPDEKEHLYRFGELLGIAFQLQDDLLDAYGDAKQFGKKQGGDIAANKKTFLSITLHESMRKEEMSDSGHFSFSDKLTETDKIREVLALYDRFNIREKTIQMMNDYYDQAISHLDQLTIPDMNKIPFRELASMLMERQV